MRKFILLFLIISIVISCKSTKNIHSKQYSKQQQYKRISSKKDIKNNASISNKIINNANFYKGTKYLFGGTTKKGIDCSGLIYVAYKKENILLPRISRDIANQGKTISLNQVQKGDLLFFKTSKRNRINHVGMVIKTIKNEILFIHSSTKQGVIISSMNERYYKTQFVKAKRIL